RPRAGRLLPRLDPRGGRAPRRRGHRAEHGRGDGRGDLRGRGGGRRGARRVLPLGAWERRRRAGGRRGRGAARRGGLRGGLTRGGHLGYESSVAAQNGVKAMLAEAGVQIREALRRQFAADSEDNPLAVYQRASLAVVKQTSDQHNTRLQEMNQTIQGLRVELE